MVCCAVSVSPAGAARPAPRRVVCVDLFCGAGGLTHGLAAGGINVVAGVDCDEESRWPYEGNNPASTFHVRDIADVSGGEVAGWFGSAPVRVLSGCAPCQPFSTYTQRGGRNGDRSGRWGLLSQFGRLAGEVQPDVVVMENVPAIRSHAVFTSFVATLKACDYEVWHNVVNCADYGAAQSRRRTVLMASRLGVLRLPDPTRTNRVTARDIISTLPPIPAGGVCGDDPLHAASRLSPLNMRRMRASRPGGTWRDWPAGLRADCHRRASGAKYLSVYGRIAWDEPAPTLTTQFYRYGSGRFGHPDQDRGLSLREGALLQGFPPGYEFMPDGDTARFSHLGRLIGNAVPVQLGCEIGRCVVDHARRRRTGRLAHDEDRL